MIPWQWILTAIVVGLLFDYVFRGRNRNRSLSIIETMDNMTDCTDMADRMSASSYTPPAYEDMDDIPFLGSLSHMDRVARHMNACTVMGEREGPAGTRIQTVARTCESGMAHTADGDRIRIPDSIPEALRDETLKHELIHIWQRRAPDAWADFYRRQWSFVYADQPPAGLPPAIQESRRSNPDTWRHPWVRWMARWWPIPVYDHPQSGPRLREAHTVWWDEYTRSVLRTPPAEWTAFFGYPSQDEHPHEIAAVYLTEAVDNSIATEGGAVGGGAVGSTNTEASRRLRTWWILNSRKIMHL